MCFISFSHFLSEGAPSTFCFSVIALKAQVRHFLVYGCSHESYRNDLKGNLINTIEWLIDWLHVSVSRWCSGGRQARRPFPETHKGPGQNLQYHRSEHLLLRPHWRLPVHLCHGEPGGESTPHWTASAQGVIHNVLSVCAVYLCVGVSSGAVCVYRPWGSVHQSRAPNSVHGPGEEE